MYQQPSNHLPSGHQSQPSTAQSGQQHDQSTSHDPFGLTQFSQYYINQLDQLGKMSQSFFDEPNQTLNPMVANLEIWQESMNFFSQIMPFGMVSDTKPAPNKTNNVTESKALNTHDRHAYQANTQTHIEDHAATRMVEQAIEGLKGLSQTFINETLKRVTNKSDTSQSIFFDILNEWQQFTTTVLDENPITLIEQQTKLWQQQLELYQHIALKVTGKETKPLIAPEKGDKRFTDEDWSNNPVFDYLKQSYLITVNSMMSTIESAEGIDDKTRQRLSFFTRQWLNAIAPSNFLWSNPEVLRLTKESGGKNLIDGLKQLAEDMEKSAHMLNIRMTDDSAFNLGENIATTPGKVVFRNRMMELIQYTPTTVKVNKRPLLIVPPWINKFYILDLKEKNSYIRWALNEGHSVFVISWVNPDRTYKDVGMDTYMHEGMLAALDVIQSITGEPDANVIGYCIGGMLLALTLSWLNQNNQDKRIASATFWTTMFDFSDPGDLGVFIDERIVQALEQESAEKGVTDGRMMGVAFSLLRENSLYWNYYIQNYLKGERPTPFDLLYWNSDCTNVTAALHNFILRELYLGNKLTKKGELVFDNIKIDLSKVTTPTYVVAALQDHIVKWKGSYAATQVLGGDVTFVLGESGHVAGIINPPTGKYGFYANSNNVADPDDWFRQAEKQEKSWWLHWGDWIKQHSGGEVDSRQPGLDNAAKQWPVLGDAPGEYVRIRADEVLNNESLYSNLFNTAALNKRAVSETAVNKMVPTP